MSDLKQTGVFNEVDFIKSQPLAEADQNERQRAAYYLHSKIEADKELMATGLYEFCKDLKQMRDMKLYKELGFDTFVEYTEKTHGIKQRQAYAHIEAFESLPADVLQSNAKLGITKLQMIASLSGADRQELMESNNLEDLSVSELKKALEEIKAKEQQISMLTEALNESKVALDISSAANDVENELDNKALDKKISQLQAEFESKLKVAEAKIKEEAIKSAEAKLKQESKEAVDLLKAAVEKEATAKVKEEIKKIKEELKIAKDKVAEQEKIAKAAADKVKASEEQVKKAQEDTAKIAALESRITAAEEQKTAIEKQIKMSANPELERFKFIFEEWESKFTTLTEQLLKLDESTRAKMRRAIKQVIEEVVL